MKTIYKFLNSLVTLEPSEHIEKGQQNPLNNKKGHAPPNNLALK